VKVNDAVSGAVFVVLAALIFFFTRGFTEMHGQDYGAAFFPRVIAVAMALLGASLIVHGLRTRAGNPWVETLDWMRSPRHAANFALILAALVFYILISDTLGFALSSIIILFVLLLRLRGPATWRSSAAIAIVGTIVIQQFFGQFLRVPLPWGVFEAYAW
jgi:putative tricarboxylic transport membrane protein